MNALLHIMLVAFWITGYVLAPTILISGWLRWARRPKQQNALSVLSLAGFSLASASGVIAASSIAYALFIHGFRYYDARLLRIFRAGFLLSFGGLVLGLIGLVRPSSLRWHAPSSALATLLFWIAAAEGE